MKDRMRLRCAAGAVLICLAAHALARAEAPRTEATAAKAQFRDAKNEPVGEAALRDTPNGVLITVGLRNLPPGEHGFHVHAVGKCEPPFETAGAHFNPGTKSHGFENVKGPHAGDLPNLIVAADGTVKAEFVANGVRLETGEHALLDADGAALVIHSGPDDYATDPAGNSGSRIACGIIERAD